MNGGRAIADVATARFHRALGTHGLIATVCRVAEEALEEHARADALVNMNMLGLGGDANVDRKLREPDRLHARLVRDFLDVAPASLEGPLPLREGLQVVAVGEGLPRPRHRISNPDGYDPLAREIRRWEDARHTWVTTALVASTVTHRGAYGDEQAAWMVAQDRMQELLAREPPPAQTDLMTWSTVTRHVIRPSAKTGDARGIDRAVARTAAVYERLPSTLSKQDAMREDLEKIARELREPISGRASPAAGTAPDDRGSRPAPGPR